MSQVTRSPGQATSCLLSSLPEGLSSSGFVASSWPVSCTSRQHAYASGRKNEEAAEVPMQQANTCFISFPEDLAQGPQFAFCLLE